MKIQRPETSVPFHDVEFVLMDIDGTLVFGSDHDLQNVAHQLSRLRRYKVSFSVATGRTIFGARQVLGEIDPDHRVEWIISYNGAVIARPDARPWIEDRLLIEPSLLDRLFSICVNQGLGPLVYTCGSHFDTRWPEEVFGTIHSLPGRDVEFNGMPIRRVSKLDAIPVADVVAVLISAKAASESILDFAQKLRQEVGDQLRITTSGGEFVEIANVLATKRFAMENLCLSQRIDVANVMAIGDNFNDLEMLISAGFGVAVENSPDAVKSGSRIVTKQKGAAGVTEVLQLVAEAYRYQERHRRLRGES